MRRRGDEQADSGTGVLRHVFTESSTVFFSLLHRSDSAITVDFFSSKRVLDLNKHLLLTRISKLVRSIWSLLETYCILDPGLSLFLSLARTFRSEQFVTISTLEIDEIGEATYTADGKSYQMIVNNISDGAMDSDAEFVLLGEIVMTGRYYAVSVGKNFGGDG